MDDREEGVERNNFAALRTCTTLDDHTISTDALQFYNCLEDNLLTQHVNLCTRNDAILDLILSDEPDVVQNVVDLGPFVSSDHNALSWNVEIRTRHEIVKKTNLGLLESRYYLHKEGTGCD